MKHCRFVALSSSLDSSLALAGNDPSSCRLLPALPWPNPCQVWFPK